jgi:hypothetical protein
MKVGALVRERPHTRELDPDGGRNEDLILIVGKGMSNSEIYTSYHPFSKRLKR